MTKGEWLKLFSFFYAIIQKNINFLRRSSKKDDFIIENIFEEGNIIDDKKIIELYFGNISLKVIRPCRWNFVPHS